MKQILFAFLTLLLCIGCQSTKTNNTPILFTVDSFDIPNNKMDVTFSITNPTDKIWEGGKWSLHWNQIYGSVLTESLPEEITYTSVNGQQYLIFNFGESYSLKPGEELNFSVIQTGIMSRLVMGPQGFFIHNAKTNSTLDLESTIQWRGAKGIEELNIPSAADRYSSYEGIELLSKTDLSWIIPVPKEEVFKGNYRDTPSEYNIAFETFDIDIDFLIKRLQEGVKTPIKKSFKGKSNISIKKDVKLTSEAYALDINEKNIVIHASTKKGVFYGLESLHQILIIAQREGEKLPIINIKDNPRFKNRGFMTDVARNFFPKEKIMQILNYMALYKLNKLDLKMSDDEGWRIEIPGIPELTEIGSKRGFTLDESDRLIPMFGSGSGKESSSGSGFLSREDFISILKYADQLHIEVVPHISFPSHARAAIVAMKSRYNKYKALGDLSKAEEYMLHDPKDKSEYLSAQLYNDNVICICKKSSYHFYKKVILEIKAMYETANLSMNVFNIGADELPFGPWRKSPECKEYISQNSDIQDIDDLYRYNIEILNKLITNEGSEMAGWEDVLLIRSEKEQSEINIDEKLLKLDFTPYVWNNTWGGGREDMIYRLNNLGFKAIMSNSSAFYFDMTDDRDIENGGLSWSGYVNYKDSWGTEPLNVFANKVKLEALGINKETVTQKEQLKPESVSNFLGIQSQLWTETANSEKWLDELFMPNLIIFAQRAWSAKESWLEKSTLEQQKPLLNKSWNLFVNNIGQRHLAMINDLYGGIQHDLPKPGGIIENGILKVRQQFPGLEVRYTLDGSKPSENDPLYFKPITIKSNASISLRTFDTKGRGGRIIEIK